MHHLVVIKELPELLATDPDDSRRTGGCCSARRDINDINIALRFQMVPQTLPVSVLFINLVVSWGGRVASSLHGHSWFMTLVDLSLTVERLTASPSFGGRS